MFANNAITTRQAKRLYKEEFAGVTSKPCWDLDGFVGGFGLLGEPIWDLMEDRSVYWIVIETY